MRTSGFSPRAGARPRARGAAAETSPPRCLCLLARRGRDSGRSSVGPKLGNLLTDSIAIDIDDVFGFAVAELSALSYCAVGSPTWRWESDCPAWSFAATADSAKAPARQNVRPSPLVKARAYERAIGVAGATLCRAAASSNFADAAPLNTRKVRPAMGRAKLSCGAGAESLGEIADLAVDGRARVELVSERRIAVRREVVDR